MTSEAFHEELEYSVGSDTPTDDEPTADEDSLADVASDVFVAGDLSIDRDGGAMLSVEDVMASAKAWELRWKNYGDSAAAVMMTG
ncbi:hypothetical protein Hanom_Chr07g00629061 [Helianthus anomalus]